MQLIRIGTTYVNLDRLTHADFHEAKDDPSQSQLALFFDLPTDAATAGESTLLESSKGNAVASLTLTGSLALQVKTYLDAESVKKFDRKDISGEGAGLGSP